MLFPAEEGPAMPTLTMRFGCSILWFGVEFEIEDEFEIC